MRWKARRKLRKLVDIVRREGAAVVLGRVWRYLRITLVDAYWRLRGTRTLSVGDRSMTFTTRTTEVGPYGYFLATERDLLEHLLEALRPDDVFYDVGAYVGVYTCFAASELSAGTAVAVEPYPPNVAVLESNVERNAVEATVVRRALWDEAGTVAFDDPGGETTSAIVAARETPSGDSTTVPTTTGDRLVETGAAPPPTVVKIDVEGAEGRVLRGMEQSLRADRCRLVVCEVHDFEGRRQPGFATDPAVTERLLETFGFDVERVAGTAMEYHLVGRK